MQKRYLAMFGILGALFAGYAMWWSNKATDLEFGIYNRVFDAMPSNVEAKFSVNGVGGFPFRFVADLRNVEIRIGATDTVKTARAEAIMQPGNNDHVILRFTDEFTYDIAGLGQGTFTAERLLASLVRNEDWHWDTDVDAKNLQLATAGGQEFEAERAGLHVRDTSFAGDHSYTFSMTGTDMRRAGEDPVAQFKALGRMRHEDVRKNPTGSIGVQARMVVEAEMEEMVFESDGLSIKQAYKASFADLSNPSLELRVDATPAGAALEAMWAADVMNSGALADLLEKYGEFSGDTLVMNATYDDEGLAVNGKVLTEEEEAAFFDLF